MPDTDIRPILDPLQVEPKLKADAWDHFQAASSPEDFQARFDTVNIPKEAKAALWDAKFGGGAAPPPAAPQGPPVSLKDPTAGNLPSAPEADAEAQRKAKAYADALTNPNPQQSQLPGIPKATTPGLNAPPQGKAADYAQRLGIATPGSPDGSYNLGDHVVRAAEYIGKTNFSDQARPADKPTVDFSQFLPTQQEMKESGASQGSQTVVEGVRGLTDLASSLTSFENAMVMRGASSAGKAAQFADKSSQLIYKGMSAGLSAYFATEMGKHLIDTYPELKTAVSKEDWPAVARMVTSSAGQAILIGLAGKHIKDTLTQGSALIDSTLYEHNAAADSALKGEQQTGKDISNADSVAKTVVPEPIPVKIKGKSARIESQNIGKAGGKKGKPAYQVVDEESGDVLHAGTAQSTKEFLGTQGAQPNTETPDLSTPPPIEQKAEKPAAAAEPRELQVHPDSPYSGDDPHELLAASVEELQARHESVKKLEEAIANGEYKKGEVPEGTTLKVKTGQMRQTQRSLDHAKQVYEDMHSELADHFGPEVAGLARKAIEQPAEEDVSQEEAPALPHFSKLPEHLAGAQPRYNFGKKAFTLDFEDDADKAAYITAQDKKSKNDAGYAKFGMEATGLSEDELRDRGRQIRDSIKEQARGGKPGALKVPKFNSEAQDTSALPGVDDLAAIGERELAAEPKSASVRQPTKSEIQEAAAIVAKEQSDAGEQSAASEASGEPDTQGPRKGPGGEGKAGGEASQVRKGDAASGPSDAEGNAEAGLAAGTPDESKRAAADTRPEVTRVAAMSDAGLAVLAQRGKPQLRAAAEAEIAKRAGTPTVKDRLDANRAQREKEVQPAPAEAEPSQQDRLKEALKKNDVATIKAISAEKKAAKKAQLGVKTETAAPAEGNPAKIAAGTVTDIPVGDIHVDAPRFQFKQNVGQGGAGEELRGVTKWDPEKAGITSVWQDPKDGKTYVVNGHHRLELGRRLGAKTITSRYLDARTAKEARTKGALINIAEGRGESADAARVFRDSGLDAQGLESEGVSLKGAKAKEGLALSHLADGLFEKVVSGEIPAARGAVIGEGLRNHSDQVALHAQLEKRERGGKRATNDQIEEMIRLANRGPKVAETSAQGGLFGDEELERSPIFERAEVSDYIRKQLAGEKRLFSTVGTAAVEKTLGRNGNVINSTGNSDIAQQTGRSIALYDKLSTHAGAVADAIDAAAKELADGKERPDAVKNRVYEAVRASLIAQGESLAGRNQGSGQRSEGDAQGRTDQAGSGQRDHGVAETKLAPARTARLPHPDRIDGSADEVMAAATAVYRSGVVWTNPAATAVLSFHSRSGDFEAASFPAGAVEAVSGRITSWIEKVSPEAGAGLQNILDAIEEARKHSAGLVVSEFRKGERLEKLKARIRHEQFHVTQREMGSAPVDPDALLSHPLAAEIVQHLVDRGYDPDNPAELALEIGAHLASGPDNWRRIGLSDAGAEELFDYYLDLIEAKQGAKVLFTLAGIHPKLKEVLYEARRRSTIRHAGDPADRSPGEGKEGGQVSRAVRERVPDRQPDENGRLFDSSGGNQDLAAEAKRKLTGEELTAEFRSPLNRNNLRTKLKRGAKPAQTSLFEDAPPEDPQGSLFSRFAKDETGGVPLGLGGRAFVEGDVKPTLKEAAKGFRVAKDDIRRMIAPASRGPLAKTGALVIRENAAELAQKTDRARKALEEVQKYFESQTPEHNFEFMDRVETGRAQRDLNEESIGRLFAGMLEDRRDQVRELGTNQLKAFYQNYFPHIWKDPAAAAKVMQQFYAKAQLQGSKAFLKKRTIPTIKYGLDAGLELASNNPAELVLTKVREMDKYIMAHHTMLDLKAKGLLKYVPASGTVPEGYAKIEDNVAAVYGPPTEEGALVTRGHHYAPEPVATLLNHYLSAGLREKSGLFRAYLGVGNVLNQFQLGWSAFHLTFTSIDAATSKLALGFYQAAHGAPLQGLKSALQSPAAPWTNLMRGDKILKEWYEPGTQGAQIGEIVDAMLLAGGRARMDAFYQTSITKKMTDAFRAGNVWGGLLRLPFALNEQAARPILEWIVPRQKMGVFADLAQFELSRLAPDADPRAAQEALARAWDSVDNRMGQLVYDNLFWHKTAKDLAMASIRSVGWNIGTLRELGGAAADTAGELAKIGGGKPPDLTVKMSYAAALPIVVGTIGAVLMYLWTGHGPRTLKDYFFPVDRRGKRWNVASYVKDVHSYATHPLRTAENKIHPLLTLMAEMLSNKDFFGHDIRNPEHRLVKQALEALAHVGTAFEPMSMRGLFDKRSRNDSAADKTLPLFGITHAPAEVQRVSDMRKEMRRLMR